MERIRADMWHRLFKYWTATVDGQRFLLVPDLTTPQDQCTRTLFVPVELMEEAENERPAGTTA